MCTASITEIFLRSCGSRRRTKGKNSEEKLVTGATVTLELGIDIGSLDQVVQIGAPATVSSFAQRLGRCGRRGQIPQILFTFVDDVHTTPADKLGTDELELSADESP